MAARSKFVCELCDKTYDFQSKYDRHLLSSGHCRLLETVQHQEVNFLAVTGSNEHLQTYCSGQLQLTEPFLGENIHVSTLNKCLCTSDYKYTSPHLENMIIQQAYNNDLAEESDIDMEEDAAHDTEESSGECIGRLIILVLIANT